ncbi:MAG: hypothetical protein BMS9Abin15_0523 [Gammaproteobacteria bacterium]|nr:MAG: hypothetical protein BMS9Abin15_0523 [Gammaproteobacteria bacterium]
MATLDQPVLGRWYKTTGGESFEVVALDNDDRTIEIQYFDGTLEEFDLSTWYELDIFSIEPPEDWSGSLDLEREDYGVDLGITPHDEWANPLDMLDLLEQDDYS